ncbi:hypothetical protein MHYP_G00016960 [Metynnis hypsauchen]
MPSRGSTNGPSSADSSYRCVGDLAILQEELPSTLEFLQRCFFFSINPEEGTKVEKTTTSCLPVNPRVLTLIQELSDHEWRDV